MNKSKKLARLRRSKRTRMHQRIISPLRLVVNRTPRHIYAQVIKTGSVVAGTSDSVVLSVSSLDSLVKEKLKFTGNVDAAKLVGSVLAKKALESGIDQVSFDRSGFKYHGRVKALADSARENGLKV